MDVVWGLTNQRFKNFSKYLGHSICDRSSAGHDRPKGSVCLTDLGEPIEFRCTASQGIHVFISAII